MTCALCPVRRQQTELDIRTTGCKILLSNLVSTWFNTHPVIPVRRGRSWLALGYLSAVSAGSQPIRSIYTTNASLYHQDLQTIHAECAAKGSGTLGAFWELGPMTQAHAE